MLKIEQKWPVSISPTQIPEKHQSTVQEPNHTELGHLH